jgi:hypothetical protein
VAQEQVSGTRRCAVCGENSEARARYCWNCGARLTDTPTPFDQTLAEVVPETSGAAPAAAAAPMTPRSVDVPAPSDAPSGAVPTVAPAWTASTDVWNSAAGTSSTPTVTANIPSVAPSPPKRGVGRTIWIVLGILAFIVLFCCVASIVLVAVASNDSAFQDQVSLFAQLRR